MAVTWVPTFIDGNFVGYRNIRELNKLKKDACVNASKVHKNNNNDHTIYAYYSLTDHGSIETARFYSGLSRTESEFERIANMTNSHIYAFHKHL